MSINIEFEGFEGPFDLLLKLIDREKIDIYDINLEDLTNSYLTEIENLSPDIENISSFIYIASVLLAIKSSKLLPKTEVGTTEEDFIGYLIEYKKIKSIQDDMKDLEAQAAKLHSKYAEDLSKFEVEDEIIIQDVKILAQQFNKVLKRIDKETKNKEVLNRIRIPDVNHYLSNYRKALDLRSELRLDLITNDIHSKEECIASFLALLEMVKLKEIYLLQKEGNKFHIKKREEIDKSGVPEGIN